LTLSASSAIWEIETDDLRVDPGLSAVDFFIASGKLKLSQKAANRTSRVHATENPANP
jgi:hypothetical protein